MIKMSYLDMNNVGLGQSDSREERQWKFRTNQVKRTVNLIFKSCKSTIENHFEIENMNRLQWEENRQHTLDSPFVGGTALVF